MILEMDGRASTRYVNPTATAVFVAEHLNAESRLGTIYHPRRRLSSDFFAAMMIGILASKDAMTAVSRKMHLPPKNSSSVMSFTPPRRIDVRRARHDSE